MNHHRRAPGIAQRVPGRHGRDGQPAPESAAVAVIRGAPMAQGKASASKTGDPNSEGHQNNRVEYMLGLVW